MINLYKGDNLEVIKKLYNIGFMPNIVYLDPPYNTGNQDLIYQDSFSAHGAWINDFKLRLIELKKIIQKNTVIFVSIGHEELINAKYAMDEVFFKKSFVAIMPRITGKTSKTTKTISRINDFLIIYTIGNVQFNGEQIRSDAYKFSDEYIGTRGKYFLRRLDYKEFKYSKGLDFEIEYKNKKYVPSGNFEMFSSRFESNLNKDWCWLWSKKKINFALENDWIVFKGNYAYKKTYYNSQILKINGEYFVSNEERNKPFSTLELTDPIYASASSSKNKFEKMFSYPKSKEMLKFLYKLPNFEKPVILDAYAGSGISAVVAEEMGVDCSMIQLDEKITNNSFQDFKEVKTIYDLTKKILEENKVEYTEYE